MATNNIPKLFISGDPSAVPFLTEAFKRADGVYLMLPPMWDSDDHKKQSIRYAENFSSAIRAREECGVPEQLWRTPA